MRVGIIGCGNISDVYVRNAKLFSDIEIIACSDIIPSVAERLARKYSLRETNVRTLLAADDIEIVEADIQPRLEKGETLAEPKSDVWFAEAARTRIDGCPKLFTCGSSARWPAIPCGLALLQSRFATENLLPPLSFLK